MPVFALEVVTPERVAYSGQVASLQAPGSEGSFGVLAGHIPLLTSLQIGREQVAVLAETAERIEEIDVARAEAARQRAEERLARAREERVDVARAEAALARAINRIRVGS